MNDQGAGNGSIIGSEHFWFSGKALQFTFFGKRPKGVRQWATCLWNADIFFGKVPFLKTITLVAWLLAVLV